MNESGGVTTTSAVESTGATSGSEVLSPVDGVYQFPVGSEWSERLRAVGIPPGTLWARKPEKLSTGKKNELLSQRHYFMGWSYMEQNKAGQALGEFNKALGFDPDNPHILLDAARARLAVREVDEAQELVTKVLDTESTNVEALRLQAESYLVSADAAQGDEKRTLVGKAVDSLEQARKIQPKNLEVLRSLAKGYVQQQEVAKVISAYKDIVAVDPRDTYSLLILAQVLSRMDRPEDAIQYYKQVIEQRRGFIGGYIYLGQLYERMKRYGDALDVYKQALLVEPRNADVLRRFEDLVEQIHGNRHTDEILGEYKKFVNEYPENTGILRIYAERLETEKKFPDAIKQYEKILKVDTENVDAMISLGKIYSQEKNYEKAGEYFSKAVEINPDKLELYDAIAATLIQRKETAKAADVYHKAIEVNPRAEKLYISLAALLENDGKTTAAIGVMRKAIHKVGDKPELLAVLGKFYRSTNQNRKAETTLRKAYDKESDNLPLFGELLSLYLEENKTTAAEEITTKTAEGTGTPKDVVLSVAAEFYFNAGRGRKAMELYTLALDENPGKLDYLGRLIGISNREKLFDRSLEYLDKFGGAVKDQSKIQQLKAEVYLASKQYNKAIDIYRKLVDANPLDLDYYQYLVDAYNDAKRYDDSIELVEKARRKFSKSDPEAILMMSGMVYYKQKKYDKAEQDFKKLIDQTDGKNDDAFYFLGSVYLDRKDYKKAETEFRKAIDVNPNNANALNALGYMFADRGVKLDEAKELVSKALNINPTAPHILDSMGWVLFKEGDLESAQKYIERASREYEDSEVFSHLGQIYAKQSKKKLARQMFERVLELDPDHKGTKQRLQSISVNGQE